MKLYPPDPHRYLPPWTIPSTKEEAKALRQRTSANAEMSTEDDQVFESRFPDVTMWNGKKARIPQWRGKWKSDQESTCVS